MSEPSVIAERTGQPEADERTAQPGGSDRLVLTVREQRDSLRIVQIAPQQIDPDATNPPVPHLVAFDPLVTPRGELVVVLGDSGGAPEESTLLVSQAATNGFHAIGLSYPNVVAVRELCETNADEGCYEKVRLEILDGSDRTSLADVTQANSIENRVAKLLNNLGMRFPGEGWPGYVDGGAPKWSAIRVVGHADGGGQAAIIAREHEVARVCLLEAPEDRIGPPGGGRRLAPWIGPAKATAAERYYGFRHLRSSSPNAEAVPSAWNLLGLDQFGAAADTDNQAPPYGGSHHLTTNATPIEDGKPDLTGRSVAVDLVTPRESNRRPSFAPVWQYACLS